MTRFLAMVGLLALTLTGCPTAEPTPGNDAGRDAAATVEDTGTTVEDTGTTPDTGTVADTGTAVDTGVVEDTGPMVDAGPLMDRCTNAADMAALPMEFNGDDIGGHTGDCAPGCIGRAAGDARAECVNECIQGPTRVNGGISSGCTLCFAYAADCTIANCISECIADPGSPDCVACQCENCSAAQVECSGIPDGRCTTPAP